MWPSQQCRHRFGQPYISTTKFNCFSHIIVHRKSRFDGSFFYQRFFSFIVLIVEISIRLIAPQSFWIGLYVCSSTYPVSNSNSSQYSVSYTSLRDISNYEIKSFVPCAYCASWIFAPIEVPLRSNWFVNTDSRCSCLIVLQRITICLANSLELPRRMLSAIELSPQTDHNIKTQINLVILRLQRSYIDLADQLYFAAEPQSYIVFAFKLRATQYNSA